MNTTADVSEQLGPARDQGQRGTCLAFAVCSAHELARLRRRAGAREDLGEELLYWRCKQIDGDSEGGTRPDAVAQALLDPGQSAGPLWPYDKQRDEAASSYQPPPAALDRAQLRRASLSPTTPNTATLREHLKEGKAVVLGIDLWRRFFQPRGGELVCPDPAELLGAPHAVAVVGCDGSGEWLLIRNSWGRGWGKAGHAQLAEAALEVAAIGAWVVEDDIDD